VVAYECSGRSINDYEFSRYDSIYSSIYWHNSFLAYLDLYRKSQSVNIQTQNVYNLQPRDKKTDISTNVTLRYNFKEQMMRLHGAEDYYGIKRDIENNVIPLDKILEQKCTICGEPRNKWKGEGHKI
jgi:hypothetical protein